MLPDGKHTRSRSWEFAVPFLELRRSVFQSTVGPKIVYKPVPAGNTEHHGLTIVGGWRKKIRCYRIEPFGTVPNETSQNCEPLLAELHQQIKESRDQATCRYCYLPLLSIFRKLAGMTLPPTLTLTVPLQRNTRLFPLLLFSLPPWHQMRRNLPFLSAISNALLKPGGLLRWNKRLVKEARLLLPPTEVM